MEKLNAEYKRELNRTLKELKGQIRNQRATKAENIGNGTGTGTHFLIYPLNKAALARLEDALSDRDGEVAQSFVSNSSPLCWLINY